MLFPATYIFPTVMENTPTKNSLWIRFARCRVARMTWSVLPWMFCFASATTHAGDYTFTVDDGKVTITGYQVNPRGEHLVIPDAIDGLPVSSIGRLAFFNEAYLLSVVIPDSVTAIESAAFQGCESLESVVIGDGCQLIGGSAFSDCVALSNITVGSGVTRVDGGAFFGCAALAKIELPERVTSLGHRVFQDCSSLVSVVIPEGVNAITESMFENCGNLEKATLPSSIGYVFEYAFWNCAKLKTAILPEGVTHVESFAFEGCRNSVDFVLPDSITHIGRSAFRSCGGLNSLNIPEGVKWIEEEAFARTDISRLFVHDKVVGIGDGAFWGCENLTDAIIGNGVEFIGHSAFSDCAKLTNLVIPEGVSELGPYSFRRCREIRGVYFKGNAPTLQDGVFFDVNGAVAYHFPKAIGWDDTYGGLPTETWTQMEGAVVQASHLSGDEFGFSVQGLGDGIVLVEAATDPAIGDWKGVEILTISEGIGSFSDPDWADRPARFFRVRRP